MPRRTSRTRSAESVPIKSRSSCLFSEDLRDADHALPRQVGFSRGEQDVAWVPGPAQVGRHGARRDRPYAAPIEKVVLDDHARAWVAGRGANRSRSVHSKHVPLGYPPGFHSLPVSSSRRPWWIFARSKNSLSSSSSPSACASLSLLKSSSFSRRRTNSRKASAKSRLREMPSLPAPASLNNDSSIETAVFTCATVLTFFLTKSITRLLRRPDGGGAC